MTSEGAGNRPVDPAEYTDEYFKYGAEGHDVYRASHGLDLPARLRVALEMAHLEPNQRILDIGCGRGEILLHASRIGTRAFGIDYSRAALAISAETLTLSTDTSHAARPALVAGHATQLPISSDSMDVVFMLDVVEHLLPGELKSALLEARRVLAAGGLLVIHTMPNLWYYRFGYPMYRSFQRLRGIQLPRDPRARWDPYSHVHVNEQDPIHLRQSLKGCGFAASVRLAAIQDYGQEPSPLVRALMRLLVRLPFLRYIFCNDILVVASEA